MLHVLATLFTVVQVSSATPPPSGEPSPLPDRAPESADLRAAPSSLEEHAWRLEVEAGALWSSRNDVQIPGDTGTRFSFEDLTGSGAWPVGRVALEYDFNERHGLRALYAPVRTDGTGTLSQPTRFAGTLFAPGTAEGLYQFDTYRIAYRYRFWKNARWDWRAGITGLVRDASIEVRQGGTSARKTDLGFVPLLNLTGIWKFHERWAALLDVEGAAASQGRAFDIALKLGYDLNDHTRLGFGWRTIEGGADNDEVYSFAWLNSMVVSLTYGF